MVENRFIIFTHTRSGSSSLAQILNMHPEIKLISEPFNKNLQTRRNPNLVPLINEIKNTKTLSNFLEILNKEYKGMKHIFFHIPPKMNRTLLANKDYKIIFLSRKNLLKSIISRRISKKINLWGTGALTPEQLREIIKEKKFKPLEISTVKRDIQETKDFIDHYKEFLEENNIDFLELNYEQLYGSDISINEKLNIINRIFDFLGYKKIRDPKILEKIRGRLDYKGRKVNNGDTYKTIPNIEEINRALGNNQTGYLFDPEKPPESPNPHKNLKLLEEKLRKIKNQLT
jgi:hypothetical protein